MRSLVVGLLAAVLAPALAHAGKAMLYVSATNVNPGGGAEPSVIGYCLADGGAIAQTPAFYHRLGGTSPRRVLVHPTLQNVLYVAQKEQISVLQIGASGDLSAVPNGIIPVRDPRDLFIDTDRPDILYASLHQGTLAGFRLDSAGLPVEQFGRDPGQNSYSTCIDGSVSYQDLLVHRGLVYVSGGGDFGRIEVFRLDAEGNLVDASGTPRSCVSAVVADTTTTTTVTTTTATSSTTTTLPPTVLSYRRDLLRPKGIQIQTLQVAGFQVQGNVLYVAEKSRDRIIGFQLQPTGFCQCSRQDESDGTVVCDDAAITTNKNGQTRCVNDKGKLKKDWVQPPLVKTGFIDRYQQILFVASTLFGTQFNDGRLDAFAHEIKNGRLKLKRIRKGDTDPRRTPVRMAAYPGRDDLVYMSGGISDQVFVFKLDGKGRPGLQAFSKSPGVRNIFPNDIAVAVLTGECH